MSVIKFNENHINLRVQDFVLRFKSCVMASLYNKEEAYVSFLPIIKIDHKIYTYISRTAPHYVNLKLSPKASIIFVEDNEVICSFLQRRVSYNVLASFIENDEILQKFFEVHGDIVLALKKIDFELVCLEIIAGKAIFGAGQAYFLDANEKYIKRDFGFSKH